MVKKLILSLIIIHALIHLIGFFQGAGIVRFKSMMENYNSMSSVLWLSAAGLFIIADVAYMYKSSAFYLFSGVAIILSHALIIIFWQDAKYGTAVNVVLLMFVTVSYAKSNFDLKFKTVLSASITGDSTFNEPLIEGNDLDKLPEPVKKYLYYTKSVGKPGIRNFEVKFTGQLRRSEEDKWMPFSSEQYNFLKSAKRLFRLKAKMFGMTVYGQHIFNNGSATMDIRLFGLMKVQYQKGFEMNVSETVTFFNDMCLLAPSSLVDERISWKDISGNKVRAEFTDYGITISAWLIFEDDGRLVNFISDDRYAQQKDGTMKKAGWMTPIDTYYDFNGYYLPGIAKAIIIYPEKEFCYGQFRAVSVRYNFNDKN